MNNQPGYCPITRTKGKKVGGATVKSMLSVSLRTVQDKQYYFCREANCDVVYFSEDGDQLFYTHDIRERVYQKEPHNPDVLICYCFHHSLGAIQQELESTGKTSAVDDINVGIQSGQCACDWRNPQGDCCLGNVHRLIKQLSTNHD
ncbi:MAG: hypothetical protein LCI00_12770 [Chloroflexi bacterium]|nr:hypothetical protein [Chloroflexota bacterium]